MYRTRHTLTVAQRTGVFAVFAFLKHSQRLEQIDVLRQRRRGGGHLHVGGSFRYALRVPPVARLALYRQEKKNGQPKVDRLCRDGHELGTSYATFTGPFSSPNVIGLGPRVRVDAQKPIRHESDPKPRFYRKCRTRRIRY